MDSVVVISNDTTIVVGAETSTPTVITVGIQGPPGPPGANGPGGDGGAPVVSLISGGTVSANTAVAVHLGRGINASSSSPLPTVGLAVSGVNNGGTLTVQYAGQYYYNGWNWTEGLPVFVGANGVLTQTPPTTGYMQVVGYPLSSTLLLIDIEDLIVIN